MIPACWTVLRAGPRRHPAARQWWAIRAVPEDEEGGRVRGQSTRHVQMTHLFQDPRTVPSSQGRNGRDRGRGKADPLEALASTMHTAPLGRARGRAPSTAACVCTPRKPRQACGPCRNLWVMDSKSHLGKWAQRWPLVTGRSPAARRGAPLSGCPALAASALVLRPGPS